MSFLSAALLLSSCVNDPTIPVIITGQVTDITINSVKISGEVTDDGGAEVTVRGFCWGISTNPTMQDDFIPSGTGQGEFTSTIETLEPNTTYYIRAFAQNSVGIAYGNELTFTTGIGAPQVTTGTVSGITATSAVCGGTITYNGGAEITARGVCWSTLPEPDLEDSFTTTYTGSEAFFSTMTNLLPGTKYYVRSYVKNSSWTVYGEQVSFNTKLADIEGNLYNVIIIGQQTWMAENLKTTKLNDNTPIPNVEGDAEWIALSTTAFCWLRNEIQYKDVYGALYNWYTVSTAKLCPEGWHVPTDDEFKVLEQSLGMTAAQANLTDWRGTDQGAKMKSTTGWADGENGTNSSGFSALPGGYRFGHTGAFNGIGMLTYWWSSENSELYGWYRRLDGTESGVFRSATSKVGGKYIRCVKD
ncbi:MAG: fibrobacter succinogenes major paralogous domain-containing protein [Bacteroidales bacterium]